MSFRYYQEEADQAIYEELLLNNQPKCIVKMFCGTGKSLLMRKCKVIQDQNLVVYVFPSLSLIDQFHIDYLHDLPLGCLLKISSEMESTTDPVEIQSFLLSSTFQNKVICITYQSFKTLLDNLNGTKIDVCLFDEAHHAVGETYQKLIFDDQRAVWCEKQIFFTATPKNSNGIIMYDREQPDAGMCGKLVYDYSYLRGMNEGYLNPFEIRIDLSTENSNRSLYDSIARAILASGNNRVLTFHSDVNTDRDTSVFNFVNELEFQHAFHTVLQNEFPEKNHLYKRVSMIGLGSKISGRMRRQILDAFDQTPDDQIVVIASCETIGEGIDTKNANMCVFVDPKTSYVKIIQNIGRIVRKPFGKEKPHSTILIPYWVDRAKYEGCSNDREKCDEVIRQDMSDSGGNFNAILNVLSALKQEDEELYDICLHYPDTFSPQEIENSLRNQGFQIGETIGDGNLLETVEHLLDTDIDYEDYEDCESEEETILKLAEENDVQIEIHTNSLEEPIIKYNSESQSGQIIRLYKNLDVQEEIVYQPIVTQTGVKRTPNTVGLNGPKRSGRPSVRVHTNPDIKVLWNITSDFDIGKDICSAVIDCEVVKYDAMEVARGIVERAMERGGALPRQIIKTKQTTPELIQEAKDAVKLENFKMAIKGIGSGICPEKVRDYLDVNLPGWRMELHEKAMQDAKGIAERAKIRGCLPQKKTKLTTPESIQESRDAKKIVHWRRAINGQGTARCPNEVREYLDVHLPNWMTNINLDDKAMEQAIKIVQRAKQRGLPQQIKKSKRTTLESIQEFRDATKLGDWKKALKCKGRAKCPEKVCKYLDKHLPTWRAELDAKSIQYAKEIVDRVKARGALPKWSAKNNRASLDSIQEYKDARKLSRWKSSLTNKYKRRKCPDEVREYLDVHLPGWREVEEEETSEQKKPIKSMKRSKPSLKDQEQEEPQENKRKRVKTEISVLHQRYKTLKSSNLNEEFRNHPDLWHTYHAISEENEQTFPVDEIPRNRIIQELDKIKTKRTKLVVDMGCGKAQIAQHFQSDPRFQFLNYDHVSCNESVISCDISRTPLDDHSAEICILSLAMWGSNCSDYVEEAHRILETNGKLYIIEPTKRWSDQDLGGERLRSLLEEKGFRILEDSIQKFCLFMCMKA